jgi:hypothetical protein
MGNWIFGGHSSYTIHPSAYAVKQMVVLISNATYSDRAQLRLLLEKYPHRIIYTTRVFFILDLLGITQERSILTRKLASKSL